MASRPHGIREMKSRHIAVLALVLLAGAATPALAQEHPRDRGGDQPEPPDREPRDLMGGQAQAPRNQFPRDAPRVSREVRDAPAPTFVAPPAVAPQERQTFQAPPSPQEDHARFGAPPPAGGIPRGGSGGPGLMPNPNHDRGADQVRGPERNGEVVRGGGERGWDRPHEAGRGREVEHAHGDPSRDRDRRQHGEDRQHGDDREHRGDRRDGHDHDHDHDRDHDHDHDHDRNRGDVPRWERGRYPSVYSAPRRFHISPYRQPYGFYARSWGFGDILPRGWYGDSYWLDDFWGFDLPYPPPGYAWVRVGDDAVMIDRFNGRIVQVVRGIFW